jgi:hypothetical protein
MGSGKTVSIDPILGISSSVFPYIGRRLRVVFFRRRKLNCSTSTDRNRKENNRARPNVIIMII